MCERKPGPRCSSDTLKSFKDLKTKFEQISKEVRELLDNADEERQRTGNTYFPNDYDKLASTLQEKKSLIERNLIKAEFDYDSSPEGIKELTSLLSTVGDSVRVQSLAVLSAPLDEETHTLPYIKVRIPKKLELNKKLKSAVEHREWQTKVLKVLDEAEKVVSEKALFIAGVFNDELSTMIKANEDNLETTSEEITRKIAIFHEDPSKENEQALALKILKHTALRDNSTYLAIRKDDLTSYVSTLSKKVTIPSLTSL